MHVCLEIIDRFAGVDGLHDLELDELHDIVRVGSRDLGTDACLGDVLVPEQQVLECPARIIDSPVRPGRAHMLYELSVSETGVVVQRKTLPKY